MTDRVGQQFGSYQIVKLLGQGGSAQVYLGKHRYLNSYAALKVLSTRIRAGDEQKVLAEAQTLVDLRHSNIVHLLDFSIENGIPVLIMDYAPKGSLRQHCPDGTRLPFATVVDFVGQIATALQYAHNHNVIHRDVKPENILLDADNRLLLSDFGLSLLTPPSQQLSTQEAAGTPHYVAPEQLRGKPCFASDQYALAVMVYEWLCGELPFRGNRWEIWHQHMYTDPLPLRTIRPELPPRLEKVVLRSLAKEPQDRFVSIQAFARALAQASQTLTPVDENTSQVTAPLQALPRSAPIASPPVALSPQSRPIAQVSTKALVEVPPQQVHVSALQNQNRVRMLRRLRRSYGDLMSQSLQGAAWLELGLTEKPDAVQNAANLLLHIPHHVERRLPAGVSITQAYDEAEHELLILGEPGAGKSTLLLDLAQQLVVRAEQDETHPLPVILPLSSWAVKRPPLQDWMAEQLAQIYDVPHKLSVQWVQEDGFLPLLDGLDEMEETARPACIVAINAYHREHVAPLVVSSRTTEYEAAAERHRLALQGAVIAQPLAHEDVDAYLARAGQPLMDLRSTLKKNSALHDLSTTPLMLNILILTYQGTSVRGLPNTESLLLQQVWDDYVQRMVERKGNSKRYLLKQTRSWLGWLARQMREHNQTVFYLEHLQPNWLSISQQSTYVRRAIRLPAIVIGILMSILVQTFFFGGINLSYILQDGVMGGLLGGLWHAPVSEKGSQGEHYHRRGKRLLKRLFISACIGLIYGLSLRFDVDPNYTISQWQTDALSYGVMIGLGSLLLQYLLARPFHLGAFSETSAPQRWKRVIHVFQVVQGPRALLVAAVAGLSNALGNTLVYGLGHDLSHGLSNLLISGLGIGLGYGLIYGLVYGLIYGLISLALGTQMRDIYLTERMRWTWTSLRRGLFNARHLRITLLVSCITIIFLGPGYGLSTGLGYGLMGGLVSGLRGGLSHGLGVGLSVGLSIGLSYWFLLGLYQGIAQERIEDQDRRVANQGIHRSLRNSVIMGIIGGGMIASTGILSYVLNHVLGNVLIYTLTRGLNYGLSQGLSRGLGNVLKFAPDVGFLIGISGILVICILTGGLATWRHYVIRRLLWRSRIFPWQAPQFLDDATARFLIRRVGGGYSFTHRLLLDHLVDVEAGAMLDANASPKQLLHP